MILKNKNICLNITNLVTSNQCANTILAIGGSPIMSNSKHDIKDLIKISKSLIINIGTIDKSQIKLIFYACKLAKENNIPIILDPVGSGASKLRTNLARKIAQKYTSIIRSNYSEILSLFNNVNSYGVDSKNIKLNLKQLKEISQKINSTLLVTGEYDYVVNKNNYKIIAGGSNNMILTTGLGCMLTSLLGALATEYKFFEAAILASNIMKKMGEKLYKKKIASYAQIYNFIKNYNHEK